MIQRYKNGSNICFQYGRVNIQRGLTIRPLILPTWPIKNKCDGGLLSRRALCACWYDACSDDFLRARRDWPRVPCYYLGMMGVLVTSSGCIRSYNVCHSANEWRCSEVGIGYGKYWHMVISRMTVSVYTMLGANQNVKLKNWIVFSHVFPTYNYL